MVEAARGYAASFGQRSRADHGAADEQSQRAAGRLFTACKCAPGGPAWHGGNAFPQRPSPMALCKVRLQATPPSNVTRMTVVQP